MSREHLRVLVHKENANIIKMMINRDTKSLTHILWITKLGIQKFLGIVHVKLVRIWKVAVVMCILTVYTLDASKVESEIEYCVAEEDYLKRLKELDR